MPILACSPLLFALIELFLSLSARVFLGILL